MDEKYSDLYSLVKDLNSFSESTVIFSTSPIFKRPIFSLDINESTTNICITIKYTYTNIWKLEDWKEDITKSWIILDWELNNFSSTCDIVRSFKNKVFRTITYGKRSFSLDNIFKGLVPVNDDIFNDYKRSETVSYLVYKENRITEDKIIN